MQVMFFNEYLLFHNYKSILKIFKKALAKIKKCDTINSWIVTGHAGKT